LSNGPALDAVLASAASGSDWLAPALEPMVQHGRQVLKLTLLAQAAQRARAGGRIRTAECLER
jgi:hypothetical protein